MCLDNYIGIKGCSTDLPTSGKYVNSLPGMSTELVDNIANSDQVTYLGVWGDILSTSKQRLYTDVIAGIASEYTEFKEVIYQSKKLTKFTRTQTQAIPAGSYKRGVYIYFPQRKYASLYLNKIYIYSAEAKATTVKGWDLNDDSEVFTKDIELEIGFNSIDVNESFSASWGDLEMFFGIDGDFETIKTREDDYFCECNVKCIGAVEYSAATVEGDITYQNVNRSGTGEGFALGCEVRCSIEEFICENIKSFELAWWMLLGAQTLLYKMASYRINMFTTTNKEATDTLMAKFEKDYAKAIKRALESTPLTDLCFDCGDEYDIAYGGSLA